MRVVIQTVQRIERVGLHSNERYTLVVFVVLCITVRFSRKTFSTKFAMFVEYMIFDTSGIPNPICRLIRGREKRDQRGSFGANGRGRAKNVSILREIRTKQSTNLIYKMTSPTCLAQHAAIDRHGSGRCDTHEDRSPPVVTRPGKTTY